MAGLLTGLWLLVRWVRRQVPRRDPIASSVRRYERLLKDAMALCSTAISDDIDLDHGRLDRIDSATCLIVDEWHRALRVRRGTWLGKLLDTRSEEARDLMENVRVALVRIQLLVVDQPARVPLPRLLCLLRLALVEPATGEPLIEVSDGDFKRSLELADFKPEQAQSLLSWVKALQGDDRGIDPSGMADLLARRGVVAGPAPRSDRWAGPIRYGLKV